MPTVMSMRWRGVTPEQYDEALKVVDWEGNLPDGAQFHVAWFDDQGIRVLDLWDSQEKFEAFVAERLMPGVQQVGITGEPEIEYAEAHRVFAPAYESAAA